MAVRFQLRRDTAANWTASNPVLALGEPGVETDTLKVKVGDGSTAWNSLAYSITKDFNDLTNTPTTIAGYNISDGLTLTALSVTQNAASGTGALTYNNTTGVFEYTPPDFAGLTGNFTGSVFADDSTVMVDGVSATINLANNTTTDLTEGTNLYYTDVRADARIAAASITDLSDADQTVQTTDDVTFNSVTGNIITSQIDSSDSSAIEIQTDVTMLAGLTVGNHIVPSSSENIDLGSASARFRDLYLSGNSAIIGDLALKRHTSGGLIVSDHSTGNPTNITTHNIVANDVTAAGNVDVTGNLTMTGYIAGPATFTIDPAAVGDNTGTVVIAGDLQVDGTTTTINSTTLEVEDKNVVLGPNAANDAANNSAGITVTQPDTSDASLIYNTTDTQWELNKKLDVTGKVTSTDIDILSNNPRIRLDDSDTDNNAEVTLDNTSLRIEVDEDNAIADSLIKFRVDADTKAVITSDGRLGIGYDSPADNIHILGSNASPNVGITLQSDDTANATAAISLYARDPSNVNKISEIKNVAGQLFIERSDAGTDVLALKSTAAGAGGPQLDFYHHSASPADNDVIGTINFNGWDDASNATTYARISGIAADVSNGAEKGDLIISTRTDASTFSEKVRVTNGGNVGIGTDDPSNNLTVRIAASNTGLTLSDYGDDYFPQIIYDSNRPNAGQSLGKFSSQWNGTEVARIEFAAGSDNINKDDGAILFNTRVSGGSLTTKVKIDTDGNVGIGTTDPDAKLHVEGTQVRLTNTDGFLMLPNNTSDTLTGNYFTSLGGGSFNHLPFVWRMGGSNSMTLTTGGRLGIGEMNPSTPLHINGSVPEIRATSTSDSNTPTMQIGYSAGSGYFLRLGDAANNENVMLRTYGDSVFAGGVLGIQTTGNDGLYIGDTTSDYSPYGTGVPTIDIRGTVAANRRAGAITFRENDDTLAGAIYSTYGGDGYAGLNFHSTTEAIKFAVTGAGGSPSTDIVTIEGSSTKSRLNVNYLANVYNGGLGGVYAYNGFIGANEVSASGSDNDSNVRVRVCIENSTSVWRSGYCWVTAASTDTDGSGASAAWYLYSFRTYNSSIGAVTLQDSGGATGDYSVAFSDDGDPDGDGTSLVIGVKVTAVGTGNEETVMGIVLGTREGPPRAAERISS